MLSLVFSAIVLGLVGGVIPGPVLAATFTEVLQRGFLASLRIVSWSLFTEMCIGFTAVLLFASVGAPEFVLNVISVAGAGILIWIAVQMWKIRSLELEEQVHFSVPKIVSMIAANGVLWTYWITVCVPQAMRLEAFIPFGAYVFVLLVQIGWFLSTSMVAYAFSHFRKVLSDPKIVPVLFKSFSLIFGYFALTMLWQSLRFFF